jgi:hypothetical protein
MISKRSSGSHVTPRWRAAGSGQTRQSGERRFPHRGTEGSNRLPYSGESGELPAITPGLGATSSTRSSAGLGADRSPSSLGQTKELRARPMRARRQLAFSTLTSLPVAWAGRWIFAFSVSCLTASLTEISYFSGYRSRRLKVKHLRGRLPLEPPRREAGKGSRRPEIRNATTPARARPERSANEKPRGEATSNRLLGRRPHDRYRRRIGIWVARRSGEHRRDLQLLE